MVFAYRCEADPREVGSIQFDDEENAEARKRALADGIQGIREELEREKG
jgi:hypothetical protein